MTPIALAQSVFLMNGITPLLLLALVLGWAWCATKIDKDADYYNLPRIWLNLALSLVAILSVGLVLLIPYFLLGFPLGVLLMAGSLVGYAAYRNTQVADHQKWSLNLDSFKEAMEERERAKTQREATLRISDRDGGIREVPGAGTADAVAHATLAKVVDFAIPREADSIDMLVDAEKTRIVARIDGVAYPQESIEPAAGMALINYVKTHADLDLEDRRRKQTGNIYVQSEEWGSQTLTAVTKGSSKALQMSLLINAGEKMQMGLKQVGLIGPQIETVNKMVADENGVVLLAAPAGQGLTTTLFAMLMEHDPYTQSIVTVEDEDSFDIEGVSHNKLEPGTPADVANSKLAAVLRTDPGVVGINRLFDAGTAQLIANDGSDARCYVGIAADDGLKAARAWLKATGDLKRGSRCLQGVISMRLIRKLCDTCKTPYTPEKAAIKKLNLPADRVSTLYHASGQVIIKDKPQTCPTCHGIGYRGRTAVFEVLPFDDQARKLLAQKDFDGLRLHLRKQKHWSLQEAGLAKVVAGITDIKEVTRALGEKAAPAQKRAQPTPQQSA